MSHRRPDPRQAMLEQTLRRALRLAADTIEPAADGLDRIHTKIAAGPPAPVQLAGWAGWRTKYLAGLLAALSATAKYLEPAGIWIRYAWGVVVDRFRPDQGLSGWVAWLRPAAAVATGLLVVVGASLAIAALPPALISISGNTNPVPAGSSSSAPSSSNPGGGYGAGGPISQGGTSSVSSSPTCSTRSGSASGSPSGSPSPTSGSPSGSPTPTSPSPSPSPSSGSSSSSTTPSDSPTSGPTSQASGQATQSALDSPGSASPQRASPQPQFSTPKAPRTPHPSPSGSPSCH